MHRLSLAIVCALLSACTAKSAVFVLGSQGPVPPWVEKAVDGDTLHVRMEDDSMKTVRIVGVDTPETVDPRRPAGCFGKEASDHMKDIATGKTVMLTTNSLGDDEDAFGRLLRYVEFDGRDVGERMIEEGYAFSYQKFPHDRHDLYDELEAEARADGRGLWGDFCEYAE